MRSIYEMVAFAFRMNRYKVKFNGSNVYGSRIRGKNVGVSKTLFEKIGDQLVLKSSGEIIDNRVK